MKLIFGTETFQVVETVISRRRVVCEASLPPLRTIAEIVTDGDRRWSYLCECDVVERDNEK